METKRSRLPLNSAYPFGIERGLDKEIAQIREMEVEWHLSYNSTVRRGYVVDLFDAHGIMDEFIRRSWAVGATDWGKKEAEFCVGVKQRYEAYLSAHESDPTAVAGYIDDDYGPVTDEITFSLERDLQSALRSNIEQLEPGLQAADGGGEKATEAGRIDITAMDASGTLVVIELKAGRAKSSIIAQVLAYMTSVANSEGKPVRGIIVAGDFPERVILASRAVPNLDLRKYTFKFNFTTVA
jgi:hypothetical protein